MDYNWFFSSLSQSAAAIVGIFSAFIITKIINHQQEFFRNNSKIEDLELQSKKLVDALKIRYFDWYNKKILERFLDKIEEEVRKENSILSEEYYLSKYDFPVFLEKGAIVTSVQKKLSELKDELKLEEEKRLEEIKKYKPDPFFPSLSIPLLSPLYSLRIPKISIASVEDQIIEEREFINQLINEVYHNINVICAFKDQIMKNPEYSNLITFSIIAVILMFHVGVIYPLSVMPLAINSTVIISFNIFWSNLFSLKGFLLSVVSTIFTGIMLIFLLINSKLKYKIADIKRLDYYSKFGNYSKYLKNMEENIQ